MMVLRSWLVALGLVCGAAQSILSTKDKVKESRIIVRYPEGSTAEQLRHYVARLEQIPGIRRAEPLLRLGMAVVLCQAAADEDAILAAIDAEKPVELAVPDSWVYAFRGKDAQCASHPECMAFSLEGDCCPAPDGVRMACCAEKRPYKPAKEWPQHKSTISLQSVHGGYITVSKIGIVGWRGKKTDPDAQFHLEAHPDGYVSLMSSHDTYLVTSPSAQLVAWHRGHGVADDWEKFKLIYNSDDTISLRSKVSDKHVSLENSSSDMLAATTEKVEISERFLVTMRHGEEAEVPNDQSLSKLWAMDHFGDRDIDAFEAWKIFHPKPGTEGVVVAVIDTGIDYTHPDLRGSMWVNPHEIPGNGIDDDGNGIVDDIHGADFAHNDGDPMDDQMHGTHCAGTIAAQGNNSLGIAGVAWKGAKLMALKFLDSEGKGLTGDAVKSMNYAIAMGAKILSNSWGGGGSSSALRVAIERAEHAGVLFLAAAGNDGLNNDELPSYPANYPMENIISVASTTQNGDLSLFSCYGKKSVDVAAPGSDIYSTIPNGDYASLSGTSMATPHVAGLAAMIWMQRPDFSMIEVKEIILRSTVSEKALENACVTGGRINAQRAVKLASIYPAPRPPIHAPSHLQFVDTNPAVGRIGGDAVITTPEDQSDVEHYSLHFLSSAGVLMERIGQANVSSERSVRLTLDNLTVPRFAKKIAAVAVNGSGRMPAATAAVLDIEDYGVPQDGPGGITFKGDADVRGGRVSGEVRIRRAGNEKTVSHYNIYWKHEWQKSLVGAVGSINFLATACSGNCSLLNTSYEDGVWRYHRDAYGNYELAVITFSGPAKVKITKFLTESYYDTLEIAGTKISGTDVLLPKLIPVPAGEQKITWSSDHSEGEGGWTFELWQEGAEAVFNLPEMQAHGKSQVEVVAAYGKTELWQAARAVDVEDFDFNQMAPSEAFWPRKVEFPDEDVAEGRVSGTVTLHLPKLENVKSVVNSYVVYVADIHQKHLGKEWHQPLTSVHDGTLQFFVEPFVLPPGSSFLMVCAENAQGRGPAMAQKLVDIVRSRPVHANFSGDEDPVELQIEGKVTVIPARNPTNVIAYSVYLANGAEKQTLLGRVAAAGSKPVFFKVHAAYKTGQNLLVVSFYSDLDMDEGVVIPVEDFVEAYNEGDWYDWGGYGTGASAAGGRPHQRPHHRPNRTVSTASTVGSPKPSPGGGGRKLTPLTQNQPWLEGRQNSHHFHDFQLLWTDEALGKLPVMTSGRLPRAHGRQAVFCMLTIHGFLEKSAGDSEPMQFVPPSVAQRQGIAETLADALPAVQHGQVKLSLGRASRTLNGAIPAPKADLVIDFEILPPRKATAESIQLFFDRVEAKLILLSQGGVAASRFASALASRFPGLTTRPRPWHITMGEPQQVAPRRRALPVEQPGRKLAQEPDNIFAPASDANVQRSIFAGVIGLGVLTLTL